MYHWNKLTENVQSKKLNVTRRVRFFGKTRIRIFDLIYGPSKEPTNPQSEWIRQFLWYTMIRVILNKKSGFGFSQRNVLLQSYSSVRNGCPCFFMLYFLSSAFHEWTQGERTFSFIEAWLMTMSKIILFKSWKRRGQTFYSLNVLW